MYVCTNSTLCIGALEINWSPAQTSKLSLHLCICMMMVGVAQMHMLIGHHSQRDCCSLEAVPQNITSQYPNAHI